MIDINDWMGWATKLRMEMSGGEGDNAAGSGVLPTESLPLRLLDLRLD